MDDGSYRGSITQDGPVHIWKPDRQKIDASVHFFFLSVQEF
jgi:hypothetical protein